MEKSSRVARIALLALVGSAWAGGAAGQQGQASGSGASLPQVVLSTMHQVNQLEMRLGRMAEEQGASTEVRRYGDRLYRDHRFGDGKVTSLAASQDLALLPPEQLPAAPELMAVGQAAQKLEQESGPTFDRAFLQVMIQSHQEATGLLRDALGRLPDGQVHALVSKLLPILEQHLELARAIRNEAAEG